LLTEALTAKVKIVFADETGLMGTTAALTATFGVIFGMRVPDVRMRHVRSNFDIDTN